jgi:hypothetical protein
LVTVRKAAFNKKKALFTSKFGLNLRKKLARLYVGSITVRGTETWTLRKIDLKYLEIFEMWRWSRMEKISKN